MAVRTRFSSPLPAFVQLVEASIPEAWFIRHGHLFQLAMHAPPADDVDSLSFVWFRGFLQSLTFK